MPPLAPKDVVIGCSGFPEARARYFQEFRTVEVQQTFYELPTPETIVRWRTEAGPFFRSPRGDPKPPLASNHRSESGSHTKTSKLQDPALNGGVDERLTRDNTIDDGCDARPDVDFDVTLA